MTDGLQVQSGGAKAKLKSEARDWGFRLILFLTNYPARTTLIPLLAAPPPFQNGDQISNTGILALCLSL